MQHPASSSPDQRANTRGPSASGGYVLVLSGSIAAGKSTVGRALGKLGAFVVDADRVAHGVLDAPATRERVREAFGDDVVGEDGRIDRTAVGKIVFADPDALERLEALLHPPTFAAIAAERDRARASGRVLVIDVPHLTETAFFGEGADLIVFVDAPLEERRRRTIEDRGWDPDELARREGRQRPVADGRASADVVIDNDGDPGRVTERAAEIWRERIAPKLAADRSATAEVATIGGASAPQADEAATQ